MKNLNRHHFRQALDGVATPALIIDPQHPQRPVVYANPAAGQVVGLLPDELAGRSAESLLNHALNSPAPTTWFLSQSDGVGLPLTGTPLFDEPGRVTYWLLTAQTPALRENGSRAAPQLVPAELFPEPMHLKRPDSLVSQPAPVASPVPREERTDSITGIPGRKALLEVLQRDWTTARREQHRLSVIVFRIDALESYTRLFGRHASDACLRKVAHALANSLQRSSDYCARVGPDSFAALVGGAPEEQVAGFAQRIAQRVRNLAIHHPGTPLVRYLTVSWTVASEIPPATAEEAGLLEEAEIRLVSTVADPQPEPTVNLSVAVD